MDVFLGVLTEGTKINLEIRACGIFLDWLLNLK